MGLLTANREQADAPEKWAAVARSGVKAEAECPSCGARGSCISRQYPLSGICNRCGSVVEMPLADIIGTCLKDNGGMICRAEVSELNCRGGHCPNHGAVAWDMIQPLQTQADGPPIEPPSQSRAKVGAAK